MKIAVFGIGGVGGYFGGRLVEAGHDVAFIARGRHLEAIRAHGLRVDSDRGDFIAKPRIATDDPAEVGVVDVVMLATKAWQVDDAAQQMKPLVGENTMIYPMLNGVEAPLKLAKVFGDAPVLGGLCRVMSWIEAPGHIHQGGVPPTVTFGEMHAPTSDRVQALRAIFESAKGLEAQTPQDIQAAMWQKLTFIAAFGGVGAVTRMPAGVTRRLPETRQMLQNAMQETVEVAQARGINLASTAWETAMDYVDKLPETATASMQRDIQDGKPSELDAQNGAIVRLGAEVDVQAPTHAFIYHALLAQEKQARGEL